jgi:hypothetical protein
VPSEFWYTVESAEEFFCIARLVFLSNPRTLGAAGCRARRTCSGLPAPRTGSRGRARGSATGTAPRGRSDGGSAAAPPRPAPGPPRRCAAPGYTTRPPTRRAIVADAGARCGRPAAVPHTCAGGAAPRPPPNATATTTAATKTPNATTTAAVALFAARHRAGASKRRDKSMRRKRPTTMTAPKNAQAAQTPATRTRSWSLRAACQLSEPAVAAR